MTRACRLSVYLGNADTHHHRSLSATILQRAVKAGLAGASTLQGVEGFGGSTTIHSRTSWHIVDRCPVTVHLVDSPERIRAFLPQLDDLAGACLIVCDEVDWRPT